MLYKTGDSRAKGLLSLTVLSVPTFSHFCTGSPSSKFPQEKEESLMMCVNTTDCIKGKKHCIKGKKHCFGENESFTMNNDAPVLFCLGDTISIFQHLKQPFLYS